MNGSNVTLFLSPSRTCDFFFFLRCNSYRSTSFSFALTLSMCMCCTLPCLYSVSLYPNLHRSSSSTIRAPTHQHLQPHSPLPLKPWLPAQLSRWPGPRPNVMESSPNLQEPAHLGPSKTFSVWNRECQHAVGFSRLHIKKRWPSTDIMSKEQQRITEKWCIWCKIWLAAVSCIFTAQKMASCPHSHKTCRRSTSSGLQCHLLEERFKMGVDSINIDGQLARSFKMICLDVSG